MTSCASRADPVARPDRPDDARRRSATRRAVCPESSSPCRADSTSGATSSPCSRTSLRLPTRTRRPSPSRSVARTPAPGWAWKSSKSASAEPARARPRPPAAAPGGARSARSADAASQRTRSASAPPNARTSPISGRPSVSVPVLSKASASTRASRSSAAPPLTRTPRRASRAVAASTAAGVARMRAHGQATTSTASVGIRSTADVTPVRYQATNRAAFVPRKTTAEAVSTAGRNIRAYRSAVRSRGDLFRCASASRRMTRPSVVSVPTVSARTSSRPNWLTVPVKTGSPSPLSTGRPSPVSTLWSTADRPATTVPSAAIRSPGRTTSRSPTRSASAAISISSSSRITRADLGRYSRSPPDRPLRPLEGERLEALAARAR